MGFGAVEGCPTAVVLHARVWSLGGPWPHTLPSGEVSSSRALHAIKDSHRRAGSGSQTSYPEALRPGSENREWKLPVS